MSDDSQPSPVPPHVPRPWTAQSVAVFLLVAGAFSIVSFLTLMMLTAVVSWWLR
ncbi:hypothetical protein I6B53_06900 [Schaalia sp. 19OD2882]|uniref:hypothetical protein n=1 Tax=Schaalia sp. 19OD2882 TaxID=2794089 RepID=UPI001C1EFDD6|nr:hypothetical protein [Schaalia sp. 19OD2882]QWW18877.1 hypothetical protein I6B53_06900 [Schaalia sp. 19OD2882]